MAGGATITQRASPLSANRTSPPAAIAPVPITALAFLIVSISIQRRSCAIASVSTVSYATCGRVTARPSTSVSNATVWSTFCWSRTQGAQFRSHKPENGDSAQVENVSWQPGFREELMDYAHIGLTAEFPAAYGGQPANAAVAEAVPPGAAATRSR